MSEASRRRREARVNQRRGLNHAPSDRSAKIKAFYEEERQSVLRGWTLVDQPVTQYVIVLQDDKTLKNFGALLHARGGANSTLYYWYDRGGSPSQAPESDDEVVLDQRSTIYLVGHGDNSYKRLANTSGKSLATSFALRFPGFNVSRIMIIGCLTGVSPDSGEPEDNFTQQFHCHLAPGIRTTVTGCNRCILVEYDEDAEVREIDCDAQIVSGGVYNAQNKTSGDPQDRVTYYWDGEQQRSRPGL